MHKNSKNILVESNRLYKMLFTNVICCGNMSMEARSKNQGIIHSRQSGYADGMSRGQEERCEEIYRIPTVQGR